jgi:hypothetical protein
MSYASLMVHVDVDADLGGRVSVSADLAERFRAHLIGVAGWAPMSVYPCRHLAGGGVTRDLLADSPICCLFSY